MSLTSPATQYVSIIVAVVVTAAVLLLWNRVRGPRAVRLLARGGLLLGGYAATAVAVLVSVNIAYGGLIVSVSDLFADMNPPMNYGHGHMHHPHHRAAPRTGASATVTPTATASANATPPATATPTATSRPELAG